MNQNLKIIIISGATASGKTDLSLKIAKRFNAQIINFDSLLFYKELNIGTAKPNINELREVPHHLINITNVQNHLNAADYVKLAHQLIIELQNKKLNHLVLVGGSGFYLQALLNGMFESSKTPIEILQKSDLLYQNKGIKEFLDILKENDEISFNLYHENDHYRIRRAVEHFWTTGAPFSQARKSMEHKTPYYQTQQWDLLHYYLNVPKTEHFKIIQERTKNMLQQGLIDEVKSILDLDLITGQEKPLQSIGYKEVLAYLRGEIQSVEALSEQISIHTRQLAKSQRTWFNKIEPKIEINPLNNWDFIFDQINEFIKS